MGTWGNGILQNDSALDAYQGYLFHYNKGLEQSAIQQLFEEKYERYFSKQILVDNSNFWIGLAQAQWECKALNHTVLAHVQTIVEKNIDAQCWGDAYEERKRVLVKFLEQIQRPKAQARRRDPHQYFLAPFTTGDCLVFNYDKDGNYGAAVCLKTSQRAQQHAWCLLAQLRIYQPEKPTIEQIIDSHILVKNFGNWNNQPAISTFTVHKQAITLKQLREFGIIGSVPIEKVFGENLYGGGHKKHLELAFMRQYELEQKNKNCINLSVPLRSFIKETNDNDLTDIANLFVMAHQDIQPNEQSVLRDKARAIWHQHKATMNMNHEDLVTYLANYCGLSQMQSVEKSEIFFGRYL